MCHPITVRQLRDFVRATGADFEEVRERTGACTGCGTCEVRVRQLVAEERAREPDALAAK